MAQNNRSRAKGKPPITAHPLFPASVALWFGALFGLAGLAVRPALLEALIVASKIGALIPAAAPPLGFTGRLLIALALAAIGAGLGALLARAFVTRRPEARSEGESPVDRIRRRPALAERTESDENAVGTCDELPSHRAFDVEDEQPFEDFHQPAPALHTAPQILKVAEFGIDSLENETAAKEGASEDETQPFLHSAEPLRIERETTIPSDERDEAPAIADQKATHAELLEQLAQALDRRRRRSLAASSMFSPPASPAPHAEPLARLPSEGEEHAPGAIAAVHEDAGSGETALPQPLPLPASLRAFDAAAFDDEDEDVALEEGYSSLLDLSYRTMPWNTSSERAESEVDEPAAAFAAAEPQTSPPADAFAPTPLRFDAPAVPAFGVEAAPFDQADPEETERALREALTTLKRMSSAS